ncbi:MAG: hypothetical protein QM689_02120 [Oscillospiraceae bacterium]
MSNDDTIEWLLEDENPAVQYRTRTEILEQPSDNSKVKEWISLKLPPDWYQTDGLWYRYYVTAFAECGLSYEDLPDGCFNKAFSELDTRFDCNCGDFMLLTAMVKLGLENDKTVQKIISNLPSLQLPDGGFLCLHRADKLKYVPKSCYKANRHALMFLAECNKKGIKTNFGTQLIDYFFKRNIFYKSAEPAQLVLQSREGWRTIDTFYPFEVMRVGIQNVAESFSALGFGNDERLKETWEILQGYRNDSGKIDLKGTLTKSYLPKEKRGKPSKWVTFYTVLAEKERTKTFNERVQTK